MDRYICIHGHFYQPPRENPWLEAIELQDSAYPYHDWNQRITTECYAPNGASRILDSENRIRRIVNNYSRISFNFGPTLLTWLEKEAPDVYGSILTADEESRRRFSGHGSAMAQAYNHMIMPLANARDKRTQVLWGIRDFERRFGRKPEGMWLPETAVDLETLDILAEFGIQFTVLSPYQAGKTRPAGGRAWKEVAGGRVDPSTAYRVRLPSRRSLAVFFYDGPISREVAFQGLLDRGENLARRLAEAFTDSRPWPQLSHIATDGETYGHHKCHADMALAYALHYIEERNLARLTNYGEFLENFPPTHEAQIFENSSWSCAHGVERWRSNCGCNSGGRPGWHQHWRAPLRAALDWLRDELAERFNTAGRDVFRDPWEARDNYIDVILDRSPETVGRFLETHAGRRLQPEERVRALKLLEMQRHAMLMYTSCGWFFDDLAGIETIQVIQYAGRALQLGQETFGGGLEEGFLARLQEAKSNVPEYPDGRAIYEKFVRPAMVNLEKVGAHYAISSLFEDYPPRSKIFSYEVDRENCRALQDGRIRLVLGRARITDPVTEESAVVSYGALSLGDHNVSGGVREYSGVEAYESLADEIQKVFHHGELHELIRAVDRNFGSETYSLRLLFRDEQRKIAGIILEKALAEAASLYRNFYAHHATLTRFVTDLGIPMPARFKMAVDFTLQEDLQAALSAGEPDSSRIRLLLDQLERTGITPDTVSLEFAFRRTIERAAEDFRSHPESRRALECFDRAVGLCAILPFHVNLWSAQNVYHEVRKARLPRHASNPDGDESREWLKAMDALGVKLGFYIEPMAAEAR